MQGEDNLISLKGINRNATVLGAADGTCDDLVNLRFKDGSWRVAGSDTPVCEGLADYKYLYIHTNVYSHLLGVKDNQLWWIADIDADDTFTARTPVALCDVSGEVQISQTGHLLTVIDAAGNVSYLLYYAVAGEYREFDMDYNGKRDATILPPDGLVQFRMVKDRFEGGEYDGRVKMMWHTNGSNTAKSGNDEKTDINVAQAEYLKVRAALKDENSFTFPFLVCTALELYDGSYILMGRPQLMNPAAIGMTSRILSGNLIKRTESGLGFGTIQKGPIHDTIDMQGSLGWNCNFIFYVRHRDLHIVSTRTSDDVRIGYMTYLNQNTMAAVGADKLVIYQDLENSPSLSDEASFEVQFSYTGTNQSNQVVFGSMSKLQIRMENTDIHKKYADLVNAIVVFATPEADLYDYSDMRSISSFEARCLAYDASDDTLNPTDVLSNVRCIRPAMRSLSDIQKDLQNSLFYKIARFGITGLSDQWQDVPLDDGILNNLTQQERLNVDATTRDTILPAYSFNYNGRLHLANYKTLPFHGWPINYFTYTEASGEGQFEAKVNAAQHLLTVQTNTTAEMVPAVQQAINMLKNYNDHIYALAMVRVNIETDEGNINVCRYYMPSIDPNYSGTRYYSDGQVRDLMPMLSYPDRRAKYMQLYFQRAEYLPYNDAGSRWNRMGTYAIQVPLTPHGFYDFAYYITSDFEPIHAVDGLNGSGTNPIAGQAIPALPTPEHVPNGLRVSAVDNPLYLPARNTYLVGQSEILALAANTLAVGTGQTGDAPLYVFCKDGIYALFVDASGEVAYTNARPIARDVCNNPASVTPTDQGVVFTTGRGLMRLAGNEVVEIGQVMEGDLPGYTDKDKPGYIPMAANAVTNARIANIAGVSNNQDFLQYLRGSIIAYNHHERELLVANPSFTYLFVMDRQGNWSRRNVQVEEFVNNYPLTYRLANGKLYDIGEESDNGNGFFLLTRPLKLGNTAFKQAYRLIARGYFNTRYDLTGGKLKNVTGTGTWVSGQDPQYGGEHTVLATLYTRMASSASLGLSLFRTYRYVIKHNTGTSVWIKVKRSEGISGGGGIQPPIGGGEIIGPGGGIEIGGSVEATSLDGETKAIPNEMLLTKDLANGYLDPGETLDITFCLKELFGLGDSLVDTATYTLEANTREGSTFDLSIEIIQQDNVLGLYAFGSHDGRRWAFLGGNERAGAFTDIGCLTGRADCKFFKVCLAGKLSTDSRLDYLELTADGSRLLGQKIR